MASARERPGRGNRGTVLTLLLAALVAVLASAMAFAPPADAAAAKGKVGPIARPHGFPKWYQDSNGVRLGLCLDGPPLCLEGLPRPKQPPSVKDRPARSNFPEEAFWWAGEASIEKLRNGRDRRGRALLVLAREAAFANEVPRDGDQLSFSRVRIRIDNLVPGRRYKITHPYGVNTFVARNGGAQDGGVINFTKDVGCAVGPSTRCKFRQALFGRVDPFLRWDRRVPPKAPKGYVGDPRRPHRVVGSPFGTNLFRIEGTNAGGRGTGIDMVQTKLFSVQGKKR